MTSIADAIKDPPAPPPKPPNWGKRLAGAVVVALLVALFFWAKTPAGEKILHNRRFLQEDVRPFFHHHVLVAPLIYLAVYITIGVIAGPIWWLQIVAGIGFGLYEGVLLSLLGATIGSVTAVALSRWIAADWFHDRVEDRVEQIRKLDETLGHNGLLVVMTIRLVHFLPFGLCNYALGLTTVSFIDVIVGTFLGGIPAVSMYVGIGAGYHPLNNWRFDAIVGVINVLLLLPLIVRAKKQKIRR